MSARDNAAASGEDHMTPDQGKIGLGTTRGPTAASASDTPGAFGNAEREVAGDPIDSRQPAVAGDGA